MLKPDKVLSMRQNYMSRAFRPIEDIADMFLVTSDRWTYRDLPDTLVGTGLSGALVVPRLADILGLMWAIVRKEDGTHSRHRIEGQIGQKWMFVDDRIDSGRTLRRVQDEMNRICGMEDHNTTYLGSYLYEYETFRQF